MTKEDRGRKRAGHATSRSKAFALVATLALVAGASSIVGASATTDRNVEFLLAMLGHAEVPEGIATVHDVGGERRMPFEEALIHAASRAGDVDLAALASSAIAGPAYAAGDIWVIEFGTGSCPNPTILPLDVPRIPADPQLSIYAGRPGMAATGGGSGVIIDWTVKSTIAYSGSILIVGVSDWYCVDLVGSYMFFPFVNGGISQAQHRPAIGSIVIEDDGTGRTYSSTYPSMGFTCTDGASGPAYYVRCVPPAPGAPFGGWRCSALVVSAKAAMVGASVRGDADCGSAATATTGDVHGPSAWVGATAPTAVNIQEVRCWVHPAGALPAPVPPYIVKCTEP